MMLIVTIGIFKITFEYSPARTRGHQFIKAAIKAVLGIGVLLF